jgi:hypothetical protein
LVMAAPIPFAGPVITATRPASFKSIAVSRSLPHWSARAAYLALGRGISE